MYIYSITFKSFETTEEKDFNEPFELYLDEGRNQYNLTTEIDGKKRHHTLSAKEWYIKYLG